MSLERYRYIAVDGPIGVGKTTLAQALADHLRGDVLLENAGANPFLPRFYQDSRRYALPAQMFFLFQRAEQVAQLRQIELFGRPTVADFLLEKDALFARLNLDDDEFALYQQLYRHLAPQPPVPDLVIYLQASPGVLWERVRARGINYEFDITEEYLGRLSESYSHYFHHYDASPLLIVNNEKLNFVQNRRDFDLLLECIANLRGGREFFNRQ